MKIEFARYLPHVSISESAPGSPDFFLDLGASWRLVFRPYPTADGISGEMDWNKIDSILILEMYK